MAAAGAELKTNLPPLRFDTLSVSCPAELSSSVATITGKALPPLLMLRLLVAKTGVSLTAVKLTATVDAADTAMPSLTVKR